jgi:hypothetical protein
MGPVLAALAFWLLLRTAGPCASGNRHGAGPLRIYTIARLPSPRSSSQCWRSPFTKAGAVREAVVVAQDAVVRYGPLEDSRVHFQLRNGAEVEIVGRQTKRFSRSVASSARRFQTASAGSNAIRS